MLCPACHAEVVAEALFCHRCGERLTTASGDSPEATPSSAIDSGVIRNLAGKNGNTLEPERELWRGGYSSKAMLGGWVISAVATLVLLGIGAWWRPSWRWWFAILGAAVVVWLYHLLLLAYRRITVHYLLTTQRFIHEVGLLRRRTNRIEVLDMDDISFEQTLLERIVGVGTIRILSSDRTDPQLELIGIADVRRVAEKFDDARRTERRRHGLHIEQI